jgi:hypothetical protein
MSLGLTNRLQNWMALGSWFRDLLLLPTCDGHIIVTIIPLVNIDREAQ